MPVQGRRSGGKAERGVSPTEELFPRRMVRWGAGSARREREVMPAGCCGCGDPPANPLGRRWLALRPCGAGSAPSGPGGSGSHRSRGSLGSPRDQLRACPAPPRPSRLRRARGLSCGLARGSCPRVPSGPLPTCPRALPLTSWKHPLPLPPPRRPGRRAPAAAAAPGGGGAGAAQAPPVGRRGRQSSAAVPPPVPLVGVPCQQERALGRTGPVCWLSLLSGSFLPRSCLRGAAARGPWRGRPASRRCGAQVGVRRRDAMGRDGTSWRERCGRAGAPRDGTGRGGPGSGSRRTRHTRKVSLWRSASAFHARLAARAPTAAGRGAGGRTGGCCRGSAYPAEPLQPPPAALGVSGRAVTAPRGCSGATAKLDTFRAPGRCCWGVYFLAGALHVAPSRSEFPVSRDAPGTAAPGMGWSSSPRGCGLWGIARQPAGCEIPGTSVILGVFAKPSISAQSVALCAHVKHRRKKSHHYDYYYYFLPLP